MKIDLSTELGNGGALMAIAHAAALQMCMSQQEAQAIVRRMAQGSYQELLDVMDEVFPYCFHFKNDPRTRTKQIACE